MPDKSAIAKQYVGEGDKMAAKQEHEQAIRSYGIALQMTENKNPHAFARRASAHLEVQKFDLAINDAGSAIKLDPRNAEAHRARGRAHFCSDDLELALADFEKVLELMPDDPEAEEDLDRCRRYMAPSEDELSDYEPHNEVEDEAEADLGGFQEEVQTDDVLYGDAEEGLDLDAVIADQGGDDDDVVDYGDAEDDGGTGQGDEDEDLYGDAEDEDGGDGGGAPSRPPPVPPPAGGDGDDDLYGDDPVMYGDAEADDAAEAPPPIAGRKPPPMPPKEPELPPSLPPPMPERAAPPPEPEPERPPMRPPAQKQASVRAPPPRQAQPSRPAQGSSSSPQRSAVRSSFKGGPSKKLSKEPDFEVASLSKKRFCDLVHTEYSRTKAEAKLTHNTQGQQDKWANGTCLIRSSANLPGGLVVSMLFNGRCQHFQFAKSASGAYVNPKKKEVGRNIVEFIKYYRRRKDGMPSRLERLLIP